MKRLLAVFLLMLATCLAAEGRSGRVMPTMEGIKRWLFNIDLPGASFNYLYINCMASGNGWLFPNLPGSWTDGTTPHTWNSGLLNAAGYPTAAVSGQQFGGGCDLPKVSENSGGPYCLDGIDTGTGSTFSMGGTWSTTAGVTCAVLGANGLPNGTTATCANTQASLSGSTIVTISGGGVNGYWCIGLTRTDVGGQHMAHFVTATDGTLTAMALYQSADATRRANGKIFRQPALQTIANLHPSAIRFLNWAGANNSRLARFEDRILPTASGFGQGAGSCTSLPYLKASGTDQYTIAGVASSGCSSKGNTPGTPLHGQYLYAFFPNAQTILGTGSTSSCVGGGGPSVMCNCQIVGVTVGATTTIQTNSTCLTAGQTGSTVIMYFQQSIGTDVFATTGALTNLHLFPVVATFVDATHFTVPFNSTGGTFNTSCTTTVGRPNCYVAMYESLNVGGSGAYPIVQNTDGYSNPAYDVFGAVFAITSNNYVEFIFDKRAVGQTDGAGNAKQGAWLAFNTGPFKFAALEIQTKLVNEVNELYTPGQAPTHMWITLPGHALTPFDFDYQTASDYPANAYNTIMNGANGFPGLCAQCGLFIENTNETWNFGGQATADTYTGQRLGYLRFLNLGGDINSFSTLRAIWAMAAVQGATAYQANKARTRFVMAGQFNYGLQGPNSVRIWGNSLVNSDNKNPLNTRTTFTGSISGSTLTITGGTLIGSFGIGYNVTYGGSSQCAVSAGAGLSWTVQSSALTFGVGLPTNCPATASTTFTAALAPMAFFDKFAGAPYVDIGDATETSLVVQGANDYTNFGAGSGQVATDLTNLTNYINSTGANCAVAYTTSYDCSKQTQTALVAGVNGIFGKEVINYEGGLQVDPNAYSGTPNSANFVNLMYQSTTWGNTQVGFSQSFGAGQAMPAILGQYCNGFVTTSQGTVTWIWAWGCLDSFSGTTEVIGMSAVWGQMGTYNNQQP